MTSTPSISAQRWSEVKRLFERALEQPIDARDAWLQACTEADPDLLREVRSLLAHATPADATLSIELPIMSRVGTRIGAWSLVRALGGGGMGDVYEVHRADGAYVGRAALKVLKRGMDSAAVLARFEHERRALARLSHPHIAPLFDAGATPDGLPYFVMAFVEGQTIDVAVADWPLAARLRVFLQLCDAVAYAHRNLLVHRDLKPGNVLVDTHGDVMLLDFGIAKALDAQTEEGAETTQLGQLRPYTPRYASPEQIRGEPVSTSTDIYSLGVLLYQVLTGQSPYGSLSTPADVARAVLDTQPARPSAVTGLGSVAERGTLELRHRDRLAGDMDAIVLKALEKQPAARYATVAALAEDIRAFLDGRPVAARVSTWAYRAGKFWRRHRLVSGAAAAIVVSLCGGLGIALWQAHEAQAARVAAETRLAQVRGLMRGFVFRYSDAIIHLPGGMKLQYDVLDTARMTLEQMLAEVGDDPGLLSDLIEVMGRLAETEGNVDSVSLGRPADALAHARATQALAERLGVHALVPGRVASRVAGAYRIEAQTLRDRGDLPGARAQLERGVALARQVLAVEAAPTQRIWLQAEQASILVALGQVLDLLGPGHDPEPALAEAQQICEALLAQSDVLSALDTAARPEEPSSEVYFRNQLATIAGSRALAASRGVNLDRAFALAQQAYDLRQSLVAREPAVVFWRDQWMVDANLLAVLHARAQRWPQALVAAQTAWAIATHLAALHDRPNKWTMAQPVLAIQYARALDETGHRAQALRVYADAHAAWQRIVAGGATQQQRRRAALLEAGYARALGRAGAGVSPTERTQALRHGFAALTVLEGLASSGQFDDLVALAQACDWLAELEATHAAQRRALGMRALAQASALRALAPDQVQLRVRLSGPPGGT